MILHRHSNIMGQIDIKQAKSTLEGIYIDIPGHHLHSVRGWLIADDDP